MKVTICQLPNDRVALDAAWDDLIRHTSAAGSDLVLLPEMPFGPWLASSPEPVVEEWLESVRTHTEWIARIPELGSLPVLGTRPVVDGTRRLNRGFVAQAGRVSDVHEKFYLPREPFYWEANWYQPGDGRFDVFHVSGVPCGMMICTDMWFMQHARAYGKAGAEILFVPRATPSDSLDEWLTGGRTLAMISGCFVLSSNLGAPHSPRADLGGQGFAVEPDGSVMAVTDDKVPFATIEIDLSVAREAKSTYPRYVQGD